jgi:hypothetical protein
METNAMEQQLSFVVDYESGQWSMSELYERYRITRPTGYKWVVYYRTLLGKIDERTGQITGN